MSLLIFCLIFLSSSLADTGCDGMMSLVHLSSVRTSLDSSRAEFHPALNEEFNSYLFSYWLSSPRWVSLVSHMAPVLGIPWKMSLQLFHRKLLSKLLLLIIITIFCYNFTFHTWTLNVIPVWCKLSPYLLAEQHSSRAEQSHHDKLTWTSSRGTGEAKPNHYGSRIFKRHKASSFQPPPGAFKMN